jgi:hypothetical protein
MADAIVSLNHPKCCVGTLIERAAVFPASLKRLTN